MCGSGSSISGSSSLIMFLGKTLTNLNSVDVVEEKKESTHPVSLLLSPPLPNFFHLAIYRGSDVSRTRH